MEPGGFDRREYWLDRAKVSERAAKEALSTLENIAPGSCSAKHWRDQLASSQRDLDVANENLSELSHEYTGSPDSDSEHEQQ